MTNEAQIYEGTAVVHISDGAAISDAGFSLTSDIDTNVDNSVTKYPYAKVILVLNDLSAAPSAGRVVDLYRRGLNVVSSISEPEPDANYKATYVGSFVIDAADPAGTDVPYILMQVPLIAGLQSFYIQNNLGVTISANWDLTVVPYTFKPAI